MAGETDLMNSVSNGGMMLTGESGTNLPNSNQPQLQPEAGNTSNILQPPIDNGITPQSNAEAFGVGKPSVPTEPTNDVQTTVQKAKVARQAANKAEQGAQQAEQAAKVATGQAPTTTNNQTGDVGPEQAIGKLPLTAPNVSDNTPTQGPNENHPSVQRASWLHDVAEKLAGGPQYQYSIDVNTGQMVKNKVPVSGKSLGLAIALEAISGGLTGLAAGRGRGPGAAGAAAFAQGQNQVLNRTAREKQQASDDYNRGAAIAQTNLQMLRNEQASAQADEQFQQQDVDNSGDEFKQLQDEGHIKQMGITSDQVQKMLNDKTLDITKDMLIPYKVIPMVGPDGKPVLTPHGAPKYQKLYALTDPAAMIDLSDEDKAEAQKLKLPGFVDRDGKPIDMPNDVEMRAHQIYGVKELIRMNRLNESAISGYNQGYDHALHSGTAPQTQVQNVVLNDPNLSDITEKAAGRYDLNPNVMKAIAQQESNGNAHVQDSKDGAIGPFQVIPKTGAMFNASPEDLRNPEKNADVASKYFSNLLKSAGATDTNNPTPDQLRKALISYHGAGSDSLGMTGSKYADQVMGRIGTSANQTTQQPNVNAPQLIPISDAIEKGMLTQNDVKVLNNSLGGAAALLDGNWSSKDIQNLAEKNKNIPPDSVGRIINYMGQAMDFKYNQKQDQLERLKAGYAVQKTGEQQAEKDRQAQALDDQAGEMLIPPTNFKYNPEVMDMGVDKAREYLQSQGVKVPANFADIYNMAKNRSNPDDFTPRVYKGVSGVLGMNRTMAKSYVNQFLNPDWQEQDYRNRGTFLNDLRPSGKTGQILYNAGVASQHMALAQQLFDNINNRQSPVWNKAANTFGREILGKPEAQVYDTVSHFLSNEIAKVTTGSGSPTLDELKETRSHFGDYLSPEQAKQTFAASLRLMYPRLNEPASDAKAWQAENDFRKYVSDDTLKVWGNNNQDVPGFGHPVHNGKGQLVGFTKDDKIPADGKINWTWKAQ